MHARGSRPLCKGIYRPLRMCIHSYIYMHSLAIGDGGQLRMDTTYSLSYSGKAKLFLLGIRPIVYCFAQL